MSREARLITESFRKFQIDLHGKKVLTEAASGNFVCTPILAAMANAKVFAVAKDSKYGSVKEVTNSVISLARELNIEERISIIEGYEGMNLENLDVVTNTGFVRPIDKTLLDKLKSDCVIPLMWEPWEYRSHDLDLEYATKKGIKVYGTNESDIRLQTMSYIGMTVIYFLLKEKRSPKSSRIFLIGCEKFNHGIETELRKMNYNLTTRLTDDYNVININEYDTIVVAEHVNPKLIIGNAENALIKSSLLTSEHLIIHISGRVDFNSINCKCYPERPALFGHMSYTTDFIDPTAVYDLHSAGLKVAEGMLKAIQINLQGIHFKQFMESKYPALSFKNENFW